MELRWHQDSRVFMLKRSQCHDIWSKVATEWDICLPQLFHGIHLRLVRLEKLNKYSAPFISDTWLHACLTAIRFHSFAMMVTVEPEPTVVTPNPFTSRDIFESLIQLGRQCDICEVSDIYSFTVTACPNKPACLIYSPIKIKYKIQVMMSCLFFFFLFPCISLQLIGEL